MSQQKEDSIIPHEALARAFHSPGRTAIMAAVCAAGKKGATFNELKQSCNLTDGNLSAHLGALIDYGALRMKKDFNALKPRSTLFVTKAGFDGFTDYLDTLQQVLKSAKAALATQTKSSAPALGRRATA